MTLDHWTVFLVFPLLDSISWIEWDWVLYSYVIYNMNYQLAFYLTSFLNNCCYHEVWYNNSEFCYFNLSEVFCTWSKVIFFSHVWLSYIDDYSRKKQSKQSYLELEFNVTKANPAFQSGGIIEVITNRSDSI